jgi:hypothetical protein
MNLLKILLITGFLLYTTGLKANPIKRTNNFSNYKDPLNEFGFGINAAFMKNENQLAPQLHLYYLRYLSNFFSIGASYCGIYSRNYHNALSAKISFKIIKNLYFSLNPGLYLKSQLDKNQLLYFFGLGATYQIKIGDKVNAGPMFDVQFIQDDLYLIGGFQMGFNF